MKVNYRIKEEKSLDRVFMRESTTFTVQAQVVRKLTITPQPAVSFIEEVIEETWHDVSGKYPMIVHAHNWLKDNEILEIKYHSVAE